MTTIPNDGLITFRGLFNQDRLLLTNAKALADVLVHKSYDFEKPPESRTFLRQFLGNGLIIVEGEEHKFQRKHMMPAFNFRHIKDLYSVFWSKALRLTERVVAEMSEAPAAWNSHTGEEKGKGQAGLLEINHWANKATLDIIGQAGLGRDFMSLEDSRNELIDTYEEILEPTPEKQIFFGLNLLLPIWLVNALPLNLVKRTRVTTSVLRKACLDMVHEGRALCKTQSDGQIDILSLLIKSNDFSDEQLSDQLLTFLAAG
jgi:cytochrome P450